MALITNNISGSASGQSRIGITGSMIFANVPDVSFPSSPGADTTFFVSGSTLATRSNVSVFGGTVIVSGSLVQGNFGVSGGTSARFSRAHGERTSVTGESAHAEGRFSLAQGANSHAEGDSTAAIGVGSHAEGLDAYSYGNYAHAEGRTTRTQPGSAYSHAEGEFSNTYAESSHAEGERTTTNTNAKWSHTEGSWTQTTGKFSHAEGTGSIAYGDGAHAEGFFTEASGTYSLAVGLRTIASGSGQVVAGKYNLRDNVDSLFVVGNGTGDLNANRSDILRVNNDVVQITGSLIQKNTGHVGFMGSNTITSPTQVGSDVYFYVSGSISGSGGEDKKAIFGGDVRISGSLVVGTGSITITSNNVQFGSPSMMIEKSGTSMRITTQTVDFPSASFFQTGSMSTGLETTTLGAYSFAGGFRTKASGYASNATGYLTTGSAAYSHAEGSGSLANAIASHAEGDRTSTSGVGAHAEGITSYANGAASHSEGYSGTTGNYSHAEGFNSAATQAYAHAEGFSCLASATSTHAEGSSTTASATGAHAEGSSTVADGTTAHAEGYYTKASGYASHAEGYITTSSFQGSHSEGFYTNAANNYAHAEGYYTTAAGQGSHSEGYFTSASFNYSHAEGYYTTATGIAGHVEGYITTGSGDYSHAEGFRTHASGTYSHAGGLHTIASGSAQTVVGQYNLRDNADSLFVVGNGTGDLNANRSDILRVNNDAVQITGSLIQKNTGRVGFMGSDTITSPTQVGTDVFLYVSGSSGSLGTTTPGVAAFGGDVMITGSLKVGTTSVTIDTNGVQFGVIGRRIARSPANNIQLVSTTELTGSLFSSGIVYTSYYAGLSQEVSTSPVTPNPVHLVICSPTTDPQIVNVDDGRFMGQVAYFVNSNSNGNVRITPTNTLGTWTYVSLPKTTGASCTLVWMGTNWAFMGGSLATLV